jgi:hypothetical protein
VNIKGWNLKYKTGLQKIFSVDVVLFDELISHLKLHHFLNVSYFLFFIANDSRWMLGKGKGYRGLFVKSIWHASNNYRFYCLCRTLLTEM